jgi:RNA polymerase sigma-70 factor (ECF subfamily)
MARPSAAFLRADRSHHSTWQFEPVALSGIENFFLSGFYAHNAVGDESRAIPLARGRHSLALSFVAKKIDILAEERSRTRARLMERVQDGDRESCRTLLDDIGPMLMNFLRRRIADRGEIEDVYQETLMAFFQARHTYQPSRPLEPWLFAIARNVAADHARHYWTRATVEHLTDEIPESAVASEPRSNPNLEDAVARLPEQQREAFSMLKLEGLSIEQAAERAGITEGALRVRAHRAYKAIRKLIGE